LLGPNCKAASKDASQARWLAKPENQSYFSGPVNVAPQDGASARHLRSFKELLRQM
jgi:hypothetical protein